MSKLLHNIIGVALVAALTSSISGAANTAAAAEAAAEQAAIAATIRGQVAFYVHLKTRSIRVKAGDRVRRGQVLVQIGCSGDSREAHLHFEITTSLDLLTDEGVPYVIDQYRLRTADGSCRATRANFR
jgi:multidrug resistance efflux pump